MKTNLTLKTGSFYFLSSVNLMRNNPVEVDLSVLTEAELKGLKAYVNTGSIQSSEDIFEYTLPGTEEAPTEAPEAVETEEAPTAPEAEEEATETEPEAVEAEETAEEEALEDYEQHTAKELKAMIKERDLTTKATSKKDLVAFLEEEDKNAK